MHPFPLLLALLGIPGALASGYLLLLTLASRRGPVPPAPEPRLRLDIVVPAHDEEAGIARTVESLRALDWPEGLRRVLVVADNCTDRTAERARAAGATVLVRHDPDRRGKGHALHLAFARILAEGVTDAVVVVDADTVVSAGLLQAFAARLDAGALAVQARYAVLNAGASWRTRLMAVAFALFHDLRSLGRERLGLSCGLRGNGMCFGAEALRRVPHEAFSVVEDVEYGLRLGEAGIRVHYAHEGSVYGEMVPGAAASRSQRVRWEGGRLALARRHALPLLARGLARRDPALVDLAVDLLVPPLGWLVAYSAVGAAAGLAAWRWGGAPAWVLAPWAAALFPIAPYVARGVQLSGMGLRGVVALFWAPAYLAWKLVLLAAGGSEGRGRWVRTARAEGRDATGPGDGPP